MRTIWLVYAAIWISVGVAVSVGIYVTKSADCLWAFLIPLLVNIRISKKGIDT